MDLHEELKKQALELLDDDRFSSAFKAKLTDLLREKDYVNIKLMVSNSKMCAY